MEVIQEEDESHAAKMSPMIQVDCLGKEQARFDFISLDQAAS